MALVATVWSPSLRFTSAFSPLSPCERTRTVTETSSFTKVTSGAKTLIEANYLQPVEGNADSSHADVLHLMFEYESKAMLDLLPKALHPTIPATVTFVVWHCPEGPGGGFRTRRAIERPARAADAAPR